jgi:glycosyltransferase involved in cell wall biosynthesis
VANNLADLSGARPILVHSHLRWDFVWQRPQQLFSRFARTRDVLFVEEPIFLDDAVRPSLEISNPVARVFRAIPKLPGAYRDSEAAMHTAVRSLLLDALGTAGELAGRFDSPIQWFYTPMPAPTMIGAFNEAAVVYDCMDELAQFKFAPNELVQRERFLLARSDVVFAGGAALAQSKSRFHDNVHFYGCGVDAEHFGKARLESTRTHPLLDDIQSPILGYIGVIDERLDYVLIGKLAEAMPDATIVMVGPVVKVDPRELPRHANIRWLGQQQYDDLPTFTKKFDVCLMPFAINKATEYINPTKTLEYMATAKPIVSTPVADVVRNFTPIVAVADSLDEYVAAVRDALETPNPELRQLGLEKTLAASWEGITNEMTRLMEEAIASRTSRDRLERVRGATTTVAERGVRRAP